jgi:hypothetical protein
LKDEGESNDVIVSMVFVVGETNKFDSMSVAVYTLLINGEELEP